MLFKVSNDEKMRITSAGNVGIGTSSPDAKLDIEGDFETTYALKFTNTKGTGTVSGFRSHGVNGEDLSLYNGANRIQRWDENGNSIFDGKVGIGTNSPDALLDIESTTAPTLRISNGGGTSPFPRLEFFRQSGVSSHIQYDVANKILTTDNVHASGVINYKINGSEKMRITSAGNVGIGTISPSAKLEVEGDLQVKGVNISNQENLDVDTGTETIATVVKANYDAAFFDFVIKNGTNLRAGTVFAIHDGTNVEFTETSTNDLGDTSDVTLTVDISGTDMRLRATTTSDNWIIKSLVRTI